VVILSSGEKAGQNTWGHVVSIVRGDLAQGNSWGRKQLFTCSWFQAAEYLLQLAPHLFYGVQIGAVGRKKLYLRLMRLNNFQGSLRPMRIQVIHDQNITCLLTGLQK
jgi:hypothetical protein